MSAFHPIPFADLIRRVFYEYKTYGKIFGLPKEKFAQRISGVNLSVQYMNRLAATPLGPAAGPHTQLAQNLVLAWLSGARILELKTIQTLDQLDIPRPCIDTKTVGFNVEWSQELTLDASLREYVKAWMLIEMIKASELLGEEFSRDFGDTIFDLSVGYDFKGIRSEKISAYIRELKSATATIDALRSEIPPEYARFKHLNYDPQIIESVTLSTFHGCPPEEIDHIISYLLTEHQVNVIVKLNPTLLGQEEVAHILGDVLGYQEIVLSPEAFTQDLQFDYALELIRNMRHAAMAAGRQFGLKMTNTLPVKNTIGYLPGEMVYLSGPPLHVLALRVLKRVRDGLGPVFPEIPMSFSAGVDAKNIADVASLNLTPITVCTDLLKVPGYEKGIAYLAALAEKIEASGAINLPDYVMKRFDHATAAINDVFDRLRTEAQQAATDDLPARIHVFDDLQNRVMSALQENSASLELLTTDALIVTKNLQGYHQQFGVNPWCPHSFKDLYDQIITAAAQRNLETILYQAMLDPRYTYEKNSKTPRKLPVGLQFYDCTSCGNCISVCPNNANFAYYVKPTQTPYQNYRLDGEELTPIEGGVFTMKRFYQIANFDDSCNACSLCGIHCVETGKPYRAKPKYFGSRERWAKALESDGFFVEKTEGNETILGRIDGQEYHLTFEPKTNRVTFNDGVIEARFEYPAHTLLAMTPLATAQPGHILNMEAYHVLLTQLRGVLNAESCNYINIRYTYAYQKDVLPLRGILAELPTPFTAQNQVDVTALRKHAQQVLAWGVAGVIVPALTGVMDHLTEEELKQVVQVVVEMAKPRVPVIGQVAALTPETRLRQVRSLLDAGCDGLIVTLPYVNDLHYVNELQEIAAHNVGFLLVRDGNGQGAEIPVPLLQQLCAEIDVFRGVQLDVNLAGLRATQIAQAVNGQLHLSVGRSVTQLIEALDRGVHAIVVSGLEELAVRLYTQYQAGDRVAAQEIFYKLLPALTFTAQHPALALQFTKRLLHQQGLYATPTVREPLFPIDSYADRIVGELLAYLSEF